ncbi:MAG: HEAT repeat domain-containing protein [Anaerolineae bacterium]|nr:HEAT repeat domain-containing protein [Anaerolineae bacterium]
MQVYKPLDFLKAPTPQERLGAVRVLGIAEDVDALPLLKECYTREPDAVVKQTIDWAGRRLFAAKQRGVTLLGLIFAQFKIDQEIENAPDEAEARLLENMDAQLNADLNRIKMSGVSNALTGAALGGGYGRRDGRGGRRHPGDAGRGQCVFLQPWPDPA